MLILYLYKNLINSNMLINNKDYTFGDAPKYRSLPSDIREVSEDIVTYALDDDEHQNPIKCKVLRQVPIEGIDKNLTSDMYDLKTLIDNQIPIDDVTRYSMGSDVFPDTSVLKSVLDKIDVPQPKTD